MFPATFPASFWRIGVRRSSGDSSVRDVISSKNITLRSRKDNDKIHKIFPFPDGSSFKNRVGIKKPTQKNPPKKTHLKNPLKIFFLGFFKFSIFYVNNTNLSLSNRIFMNNHLFTKK